MPSVLKESLDPKGVWKASLHPIDVLKDSFLLPLLFV